MGLGVPVPVFVGEHPLAVLALIDLPIAESLLLDVLAQALVEGAHGAAGVLLVPPQVQLGLEELVAVLAAKRGLFCNRHTDELDCWVKESAVPNRCKDVTFCEDLSNKPRGNLPREPKVGCAHRLLSL